MSDDEYITIIVDGSGAGYSAAYFSVKETYFSHQQGATSNEAEYNAVILALEHLTNGAKAVILSDSQLVVNQLLGKYKCNYPHLNAKLHTITSLVNSKNLDIKFQWIPREKNLADNAIREHLKKGNIERSEPSSIHHDKMKQLEIENQKLKEENSRLREQVVELKVRLG
jgi:ribonuclease HI